MAFFHNDDSYVSPGSIGGKIKKYRELRGLTQKQLGIACGFSPSTADVRIAQYEKNKKVPRDAALKKITDALGLPETSLYDADFFPQENMYHALFDIESFHGLHPVEINGRIYLEFSGQTPFGKNVSYSDYYGFLTKWHEARVKYQTDSNASPEEQKNKENQYELWKGEYPLNVANELSERLQDRAKMDHLQAQMDLLHAKMNSEAERKKIDDTVNDYWKNKAEKFEPIKKESELIRLIRKIIESNITIDNYLPIDSYQIDYEYAPLFSIKITDALENEDHLSLFVTLETNMRNLHDIGYAVSRVISSCEKELYITYKCESHHLKYFKNIQKYWDEMVTLPGYKDHFLEQQFEEEFLQKITGENDVEYVPLNKDGE